MFSVLDKINLDMRRNELVRKRKLQFTEDLRKNYLKCMKTVKEAHETPIFCGCDKESLYALADYINEHEPLLNAEVDNYAGVSVDIRDKTKKPPLIFVPAHSKDVVDSPSM